jgi:hypothetical protein
VACICLAVCRTGGGGKFRPSYLPEAADKIDAEGIDKFESMGPEVAQGKVTYGLQQRLRPAQVHCGKCAGRRTCVCESAGVAAAVSPWGLLVVQGGGCRTLLHFLGGHRITDM